MAKIFLIVRNHLFVWNNLLWNIVKCMKATVLNIHTPAKLEIIIQI